MIKELLSSTPWSASTEKLEQYLSLLLEHNQNINLVSRKLTEKEIIIDHILDSLAGEPFLGKNLTLADIGTGAGFPGLCLALVREDLRFYLVEKSFRKCEFLHRCIDYFGIQDRVRVISQDLQTLTLPLEVTAVISRAMCSAQKMLTLLKKCHATREFKCYLYKARRDKIEEEIDDLTFHASQTVHPLQTYHSQKQRNLLELHFKC